MMSEKALELELENKAFDLITGEPIYSLAIICICGVIVFIILQLKRMYLSGNGHHLKNSNGKVTVAVLKEKISQLEGDIHSMNTRFKTFEGKQCEILSSLVKLETKFDLILQRNFFKNSK